MQLKYLTSDKMESTSAKRPAEERPTPVIQRVSPRTIPGALSNNNKGAIDWGWQSFVAYGCHNHVVVVDTKYMKVFQTLEKHKSDVIKIKWSRESYYHDMFNPYILRLASADMSGVIIVWDVKQAVPKSVCSDGSKPIADMEWVTGRDTCHHLLVALHPPYSLIVWNTETGTKIWKKSYTETLMSFAFDPFNDSSMAFLASGCILFMDDFNLNRPPSSNGRKFYISNPSSTSGSQLALNVNVGVHHMSGDDKSRAGSRNILPRRMRFLIKADSKSSGEEGVTLNECLQLCYHRAYRHHLLLLYPREVLILDLEINQTVGIVAVEHSGSPMMYLYSCCQRDALFCLHESSNVSLRLRHRGTMIMAAATPSDSGDISFGAGDAFLEVAYDLRCQSEALRLTKHAKVVGISVCPITESCAALLISDGRIILLELLAMHHNENSPVLRIPALSVLGEGEPLDAFEFPSQDSTVSSCSVPFICKAHHPRNVFSDNIEPALYPHEQTASASVGNNVTFRFLLTGLLSALASPPHVIRMCPPVTFRNWTVYRPFMAVGNASGGVQVFSMATGVMERDFSLHTAPVRGIEWVSLTAFLSYAHPNLINSLGQVRNELMLTDVQSGRTQTLRGDRCEESPIQMLRVSHLKQYFIVAFKEEPFELWDLCTLTLLRTMSKNFPAITALEWSPLFHKKGHSQSSGQEKGKDTDSLSSIVDTISENQTSSKSLTYVKEHFVFTDTNGQLYHFSVKGNMVRDGSTIPPDTTSWLVKNLPLLQNMTAEIKAAVGSITCIAWKNEHIVLGDVDGNLNVWNLKGKISTGIPTRRGWIKKIRFGPGRGNMKILVLYNDGVDLWDVMDILQISQAKCPREMPKIQDIDWAGSDRPALATADGCIHITDINLKISSSPLQDYQPSEFPFCPYILSTKAALNLKSLMIHQPWREKYSHTFNKQDGFNSDDLALLEKQMESLDNHVKNFLHDCPFGVAERSLHVSRLFGDENGCHFWTVALHFLKQEKLASTEKYLNSKKVITMDIGGDMYIPYPVKEDCENKNICGVSSPYLDHPLDTGYDVLCDNNTYKKLQLDRLALHVYKRTTHSQTQKCADSLLLLGQTEKAVQLLLETETDNETFYVDCLRACLMATVRSSGASQSIIKLVATNLIASGHISEGVQLLCLIDKGLDACRYLQGSGRWDQAVWLAKATLSHQECLEVMKRWADHLCTLQANQRNKALLVLLSVGQFQKVLELLHTFKMTQRAALFLQACQEFGFIQRNDTNSQMIDDILLDYARYLLSLRNLSAALLYCGMIGDQGNDLKKEIQILSQDH